MGGEEEFRLVMGADESVSPAVSAAEDVADGRVRVPKIKRKGVEGKGRGRKGEDEDLDAEP